MGEFVAVPEIEKASRPWAQEVRVGPPIGVSDDDCGTAQALVEPAKLGDTYTVNDWQVYYKPDAGEIANLEAGGWIKLSMLSGQMIPHSISIVQNREKSTPAKAPCPVDHTNTDDACENGTAKND